MKRYYVLLTGLLLSLSLAAQHSNLPQVVFHHSYDEQATQVPGLDEPTFDQRFRPYDISKLYTDSIRFDMQPEFLMGDEYVFRGVPFLLPLQGPNIVWLSASDTLSVAVGTKASRAWLLLSGTADEQLRYEAAAVMVARYQDGTTDQLPLVFPGNWNPIPQGSARRLCLHLRSEKKLVAIEMWRHSADIRVGLLGLTLQ